MSVLTRFAVTGFIASFICLIVADPALGQDRRFDILILNGQVVDGTGNPWVYSDIGINDDEIVAMGDLSAATGRQTIDATDLVVAPGFIDMHTHVDDGFSDPERSANLNYLIQGVTTVRPGADGSGSYAISELKREWEENGMGNNAVPSPHLPLSGVRCWETISCGAQLRRN